MLRVPLRVTTSRVFGFLETHRVLPLSLRADCPGRTDRADRTDRRAASPCPAPHTLKSGLALGQRAELSSAGISRTFLAGDKEQGCWRPGGAMPRAGGVPAARGRRTKAAGTRCAPGARPSAQRFVSLHWPQGSTRPACEGHPPAEARHAPGGGRDPGSSGSSLTALPGATRKPSALRWRVGEQVL